MWSIFVCSVFGIVFIVGFFSMCGVVLVCYLVGFG